MCLNTQFRDNIQVSVDFPSVSPPASKNDCASVGPLSVNPIFLEVSSWEFHLDNQESLVSILPLYSTMNLHFMVTDHGLLPPATKVGARLCFYTCLLSVILLKAGEGVGIPACIAGGIPALQQVSGGGVCEVVSQHALQVSRPTLHRGGVEGSGLGGVLQAHTQGGGLQAHTQGGSQAHTWGASPGPHPGGS